jgi:hypothetical protein
VGFRVGDNFELNIDALYSKFTIDEDQNQAWYGRNGNLGNWDNSAEWCFDNAGTVPVFDNDGQSVIGGVFNNCFVSVTNVIAKYTEDKDLFVSGANAKFTSDAWTTTIDLSHSKATRENRWAAFRTEVYPATFTFFHGAGETPFVLIGGNPADPASQPAPADWLPGASDGPDSLKDRLTALRVDVTRDFEGDNLKSISFGARTSDRDKDFFRRQQTFLPVVTGTLPAELFSFYSVDAFDAPPLLNGNFNQIVDYVYGGMPVDDNAILQSSI